MSSAGRPVLIGAVLMILFLASTAFAAEPMHRNDVDLDLIFEHVGASNQGSRFYAGDVAVLSVTVTNKTDRDISGTLDIYDPAVGYLDLVSAPVCEGNTSAGYVLDVAPHSSDTIAFVYSFPSDLDPGMPRDWLCQAEFRPDSGDPVREGIDCAYGSPVLILDRDKLAKDGVIDVRNDGDGGAGNVRLRIYAKKAVKNVPDGASVLDDGRIEIGLGGIAQGGKIGKDVSGFLHEYLDPDRPWELVFSDQALGMERKAAEGLFREQAG